jgi:hypothetical protein
VYYNVLLNLSPPSSSSSSSDRLFIIVKVHRVGVASVIADLVMLCQKIRCDILSLVLEKGSITALTTIRDRCMVFFPHTSVVPGFVDGSVRLIATRER